MQTEKILFTPIDLEYQKPTKSVANFIELYDEFFHYHVDFMASEPKDQNDLDLGWVDNVKNSIDDWIYKKNVAGVEKIITQNKKWLITIFVTGMSYDIKIYYKTETAADLLMTKLTNWLFGVKTLNDAKDINKREV